MYITVIIILISVITNVTIIVTVMITVMICVYFDLMCYAISHQVIILRSGPREG